MLFDDVDVLERSRHSKDPFTLKSCTKSSIRYVVTVCNFFSSIDDTTLLENTEDDD